MKKIILSLLLPFSLIAMKGVGGQTALHFAAKNDDTSIIILCLSQDKDKRTFLNGQDVNGQTALHIAVINKKLNAAKILIESGIDATIQDKWGLTSLQIVQQEKRKKIKKDRNTLNSLEQLLTPVKKNPSWQNEDG